MLGKFSISSFIFASVLLLDAISRLFFGFRFIPVFYVLMFLPVINAVPCLIIGGILLLQSEKLVGHQAGADTVSTISKGLKYLVVYLL